MKNCPITIVEDFGLRWVMGKTNYMELHLTTSHYVPLWRTISHYVPLLHITMHYIPLYQNMSKMNTKATWKVSWTFCSAVFVSTPGLYSPCVFLYLPLYRPNWHWNTPWSQYPVMKVQANTHRVSQKGCLVRMMKETTIMTKAATPCVEWGWRRELDHNR